MSTTATSGYPATGEARAPPGRVSAVASGHPTRLVLAAMDLLDLDRRALAAAVDAVTAVTEADLTRATPCNGWDLGTLLGHMIAHNRGFTAAALGLPTDPRVWDDLTVPSAPVRARTPSTKPGGRADGWPSASVSRWRTPRVPLTGRHARGASSSAMKT